MYLPKLCQLLQSHNNIQNGKMPSDQEPVGAFGSRCLSSHNHDAHPFVSKLLLHL